MEKVEWKNITDCFEKVKVPHHLKTSEFQEKGIYPIVSQEKNLINGYADDETFVLKLDEPVIIFGDHTRIVKYIDFDFIAGADGTQVLKAKEGVDSKYLYYAFSNINLKNLGYSRHFKLLKEISIPLPSLTKQREIVTTLDSCTSLIAGLRQELTLRKKQYEYYREKMLSVEGEWKRLGEIGTINSGKCKERCEDGKYPLYGSTGEIARTNSCPHEGFRILIARVGANAGFVYRVDGKYDVSDNTLIFKNNDSVNANYIFYYLQYLNLNQFAKGGGQPLVTAGDLKNLEIPVPPLSVQQSIVERLDAFEGLISALSREVELREKQYEHLRERLLSFG